MNTNEIIMYKKPYRFSKNEYICDITSLLNMFAPKSFTRRHYLYKASLLGNMVTYAIRVPGCTIGLLCTDLNNVITHCEIDNCLIKTSVYDKLDSFARTTYDRMRYCTHINELLQKSIGCKLIFDE